MDNPVPLNITSPPLDGVNLIEASAGTGKTHAICAIFLHLLLGKKLPVEKILVVTFTVAATKELKARIRAMLTKAYGIFQTNAIPENDKDRELLQSLLVRYGKERESIRLLQSALQDFDKAAIYTIHGFCQRMLTENAFESNSLFDTELILESDALLKGAAMDFWREKMYDPLEVVVRYMLLKEISPDYFVKLANNVPLDPNLSVIPEEIVVDVNKLNSDYVKLKVKFKELAKIWEDEKHAICNSIVKAIEKKKLDGRKYQKRHMESRISALDRFFRGFEFFFDKNKYTNIDYFCTSKLGTPIHRFCDELDTFFNQIDETLEQLEKYFICLQKEFLRKINTLLLKQRERKDVRTFHDLLTSVHSALNGDPNSLLARRIRERFSAVLIDEFQDTDPLQYEIFITAFQGYQKSHPLFMIGDPKQAIYKFRGADVFAYLRASAQCERKFTLLTNFRSHRMLIDAINTIFTNSGVKSSCEKSKKPFVIEGIAYHPIRASFLPDVEKYYRSLPHGAPLTIWYVEKDNDGDLKKTPITKKDLQKEICTLLINEICRLISNGVKASDIAILVRKNDQSKVIAENLRRNNIPCVTYGVESVFDTEEKNEMELLMNAIAEPANNGYIAAALATPMFGKTAKEIYSIVQTEELLAATIKQFSEYRQSWEQHGFMQMFRKCMSENNVYSRIAALRGGERKLTNILHLAEIIHKAEQKQRYGIESLIKWFSEKKLQENDELQLRIESDEHAVKILTIHKSKGLEFPIVFCPFLYDSAELQLPYFAFHRYLSDRSEFETIFQLHDESNDGEYRYRALLEELSESVRLMYVALTRAKARCYTLWGYINESGLSAPVYVFHGHRIENMEKYIKNRSLEITPEEILEDLQKLGKQSKNSIKIERINLPCEIKTSDQIKISTLSRRELSFRNFAHAEKLKPSWSITSFSSLVFKNRDEHYEAHLDAPEEFYAPFADAQSYTIHRFPRGTRAGNFIHKVFERINFQLPRGAPLTEEATAVVQNLLNFYGFEREWLPCIGEMVANVVHCTISDGKQTFRLFDLSREARIHELEFYFPVSAISIRKIATTISEHHPDFCGAMPYSFHQLEMEEKNGFVRGFMDLVFHFANKWYILDWKSNYLGPDETFYGFEQLKQAMIREYYHLQYFVYAIALHRHLCRTLPAYNYDDHFGGVFYLFVRGIHKDYPHRGIYFCKPEYELIRKLDTMVGRSIL
ncbi:MAG: exodeoxyribonuclease V subunit beta [Spirochaetes bacterium]|nr:exodeoxyribonuclease V subunit beta [Spirochaetota bacterium]